MILIESYRRHCRTPSKRGNSLQIVHARFERPISFVARDTPRRSVGNTHDPEIQDCDSALRRNRLERQIPAEMHAQA